MWKQKGPGGLCASTPNTPTKDVFQAVCDEIGRRYQEKGLKYARSKRELKWKGRHIWCQFGLFSSHSNIRGQWVNLEIVTSMFALEPSEMERKGILSFGVRPKNFNVYQLDDKKFDEILSFMDDTIRFVESLDTKEGLETFLSTASKQAFIEKNPNNLRYLRRFGLED